MCAHHWQAKEPTRQCNVRIGGHRTDTQSYESLRERGPKGSFVRSYVDDRHMCCVCGAIRIVVVASSFSSDRPTFWRQKSASRFYAVRFKRIFLRLTLFFDLLSFFFAYLARFTLSLGIATSFVSNVKLPPAPFFDLLPTTQKRRWTKNEAHFLSYT